MANPKHLRILQEGTDAWNQWRAQAPDIRPNLGGADLRQANLCGADFRHAALGMTLFSRASLQGANLRGAYLRGADLREANLRETNLFEANLFTADLSGADLRAADLSGADLTGANLFRTNLTGTVFNETVLADVNLSLAECLTSCEHTGPSAIDYRTLAKSASLPLVFLQGCGLPDNLIDFLPSLFDQPIQFHSLFISYSSVDHKFAARLYSDLQSNGVRCWFAPHDLRSGRKIYEQIDEAIHLYDRLLLILSPASIQSEWVKTEIAGARRRELKELKRVLFPVRLVDFETLRDWVCFDPDTGKDSAREIREYFIPDFTHWTDHDVYLVAFQLLLRDLAAEPTMR